MAKPQRSSSRGRGPRSFVKDGFEILVGRGDAENDELTFRLAEPRDFWLHVAGYSGSHVVIRNPDGLAQPPKEVLDLAAQLAAWHSKARGSRGKVEVHHCRVSEVGKRRGAPRGQVELRRYDTVKVYAREPLLEEGGLGS
jgi:predicted ribosome quality control (RQC) complex YloA/Tae2 family protein